MDPTTELEAVLRALPGPFSSRLLTRRAFGWFGLTFGSRGNLLKGLA